MTKKHFRAIAASLQYTKPISPGRARSAWGVTVKDLARVLSDFNPAFDREKFLKACCRNGEKSV